MRKLLLFTFTCTMMVLGFSSCSDDDNDGSEKKSDNKVALIFPSGKTVSRWADDAKFLKDALISYGYEVKLYSDAEETQEGAELQVKQLDEALKAGYTHFVITPIDYKVINDSKLLQNNRDCDFISYDRMIMDNDAVDYYVTCDPYRIGEMQAQFLLQYFRASGSKSMAIEYFAGPETDRNASIYFSSAYSLLSSEQWLNVPSGKTAYKDVALQSWTAEDAKAEMLQRLEKNGLPDLVLAPNDNVAEGVISAIEEKGFTKFPVITGQDLTSAAKANIKAGKQAMSIYKEYEELAKNAAIVVNSFILGNPVKTGKAFNNGAKDIPVFYSEATQVTIDNINKY